MTIDQIIIRLQSVIESAEIGSLDLATAEEHLDSCYVSLNAKTLMKAGARAPNINMDFAEARDEIERAMHALKNDEEMAETLKHASEALAYIRCHGSTKL